MKGLNAVLVTILLLMIAVGCGGEGPETGAGGAGEILVVTTIYPIADITAELGGDLVEVHNLLPGGASPHTYEATVEQARLMEQADLFVYIGAGLDDWAAGLTQAAGPGLQVLNLSEKAPLLPSVPAMRPGDDETGDVDCCGEDDCDHHPGSCGEEHNTGHCDHDHGPADPHFWLDPLIVRDDVVPAIYSKLVDLAPEHGNELEERFKSYRNELTLLHSEIEAAAAGFTHRNFISFHSAWQYFALRYGLQEVAVIARFPGQEPHAGWIAGLVELMIEKEIGAIYAEPQFSTALAESLAGETGSRVLLVDPLGGENVPGRESYLALMRFNLASFAAGMD